VNVEGGKEKICCDLPPVGRLKIIENGRYTYNNGCVVTKSGTENTPVVSLRYK